MVPTGLRQVLNYINSYVAYRDARGFVHNINCHLKTIARSFKETCGDLFILAQKTEEISIKKKLFFSIEETSTVSINSIRMTRITVASSLTSFHVAFSSNFKLILLSEVKYVIIYIII